MPQDAVLKFGGRIFSFFDNPDYFGSYLTLVIPLTATAFFLSNGKKKSVLYFIIFCTQLLSLLESQTRSAWLGIAVGFIIITLWFVWRRKKQLRKIAFSLAALFLIFIFSNLISHQNNLSRAVTITNDVQKIITNEDAGSAGASRWYIWQASMSLITKHFWLGTGPNTFKEVFHPSDSNQVKRYLGDVNKIYDENNDYLQMALTMGIPALLVYLLFLSIIVLKGFKQAKEMNECQQQVSYGLLAAIIGYLVQAFFNIGVVSDAPYFWLLLGFLVNRNRKGSPGNV